MSNRRCSSLVAVGLALCAVAAISAQSASISARQSGTVKDVDGNVYKTVQIGNQVWMAENLKTTHYRDGSPIPNVREDAAWNGLSSGAYCDYANDTANAAVYGRLYNHFAVADGRQLAPRGWHIPSEAEWAALEQVLGGDTVANPTLKEAGNAHYTRRNSATNESGFTALPGGVRWATPERGFEILGMASSWWTATEVGTDPARAWSWHIDDTHVLKMPWARVHGGYVRCVQDGNPRPSSPTS